MWGGLEMVSMSGSVEALHRFAMRNGIFASVVLMDIADVAVPPVLWKMQLSCCFSS